MNLSAAADSMAASDTLSADSLSAAPRVQPQKALMAVTPAGEKSREAGAGSNGVSWVMSGLVLIFVVACLRYRKNTRYFATLLREVFEMRERHNAFDDTVRETAFLWLLNILWCASVGVLLYGSLCGVSDWQPFENLDIGKLGICCGMALAYTLFLTTAYSIVGNVFADPSLASLWTKGYLSIQGLETIVMFPLAVLGLCSPGLMGAMVTLGVILFVLAKILFIYKGFCIFFTEIASWVLFLYYLCSLEIVPVVLTYAAASYLCN